MVQFKETLNLVQTRNEKNELKITNRRVLFEQLKNQNLQSTNDNIQLEPEIRRQEQLKEENEIQYNALYE